MPEKPSAKSHSLTFSNNILTVSGIVSVTEISENEACLKLFECVLTIRGSGLNVIKLDREQGTAQLETQSVSQIIYRHGALKGGLKGLFR